MTEQEPTQESSAEANAEQQPTGDDLIESLTELGEKFVEVVQVAWNSDQRKRLEADVKSGLSAVADNLEESLRNVETSEEGRQVMDKAEDVAESVTDTLRTSEVVQNLASGLMMGLQALGDQLESLSTEIKERNAEKAAEDAASAAESAPADDPAAPSDEVDGQEIPIDQG